MTTQSQTENNKSNLDKNKAQDNEKVLCPHCLRTASNGLKCKGICVSDNDY